MLVLGAVLAALLGAPALLGLLAWLENLRGGELPAQRALCRGRLLGALLAAWVDSVWTLWLTALLLPLWRLLPCRPAAAPGAPAVILVHGLYHNPAAWLMLRRRLARAGLANLRCYAYPSFGRSFADIALGLEELVLRTAREAPAGRVALVGHSLGGLVIRAACARARDLPVCAVVTLGTPHRGSTLAARLGVGRLARGIAPGGEALALLRGLPPCPGPGLSLFTPTDCMVQPLSGLRLERRELDAGWREEALPPMSHVGLLYDAGAHARMAAFLAERCCGPGATARPAGASGRP